ncbi:Protein of unknown function DUF962 [Cynara cardunculus var. scolymus]|uniref:Uncharacterized protein n=1 Tax=Cynara cardunculus var. scolymus TaxID=59895 RepID=A0A124SFI5_CYNCS|nr:Protein of unknown function DUF962 [Cynara cardunculus var. scolymus]
MVNFRSMEEFWLFYMNQHSKPATRRWHFAGTLSSLLCLIYALVFNWWFLFCVPLFGYGMAWYSHFYVEGNIPATFGHPIWSLLCDWRMFGLMLTGQMDREIKRLAVPALVPECVSVLLAERFPNMAEKRGLMVIGREE